MTRNIQVYKCLIDKMLNLSQIVIGCYNMYHIKLSFSPTQKGDFNVHTGIQVIIILDD